MSQNDNSKLINVLVIGTDLAFAKSVQASLTTLQSTNKTTTYRVFPAVQKDKMHELLDKHQFHSVLLEEEFAEGSPEIWLKIFKDKMQRNPLNVNVPVILVSSKSDLNKSKGVVKWGYRDHLIKPLDQTLFLQKMSMYNKDVKLSEDKSLLFSMDISKEVDVGFYFKTKSVSEFGMVVISDRAIDVGSVVSVYSNFMEETVGAVVTEVNKAVDHYHLSLMFIGVTPAQTQSIRKLIRTEYAEVKKVA